MVQPLDTTAQMPLPIARIGPRRKISPADVESMATLITKRLTATEAALVIGITPNAWFQWCQRAKNNSRFEQQLARIRGSYIAGNLEQMEKAANGRDGIRHDWRAADRLNAVVDFTRYGQQQQQDQGRELALPSITVNVWTDLAGTVASPGQVIDVPEVKALADKKPE